MNNPIIPTGYVVLSENTPPKPITLEEAIAENEKFEEVLRKFDASQETEEERRTRLEAEDAAAAERKKRQERILELQTLIAELRSQLTAAGGQDAEIEARISAAQTELFWLMFAL